MASLNQIFTKVLKEADKQNRDPENVSKQNIKWFADQVRRSAITPGISDPRRIVKQDPDRFRRRFTPSMFGKMYLFRYLPKNANTLPYWDEFPLVIPIRSVTRPNAAFYGINLHYLPRDVKIIFLANLYRFVDFEEPFMPLTYTQMKSLAILSPFKPTFKKYLINRVASPFITMQAEEWTTAPFLPMERFHNEKVQFILEDSRSKI
jgi:hypothetical protein